MGYGQYSIQERLTRAKDLGYDTKSSREIFKSRSINNAMDPHGVDIRESRDSDEHPESLAIIIALDVTGSMGSVPHYLVKKGLPTIVESVISGGAKDPQILFLGIGDHKVDSAPLQVGQFESSDELMDKWLTSVYLEGGGGANEGESYFLAWYFASKHTSIDCFEKRHNRGFLFTIGDEPCIKNITSKKLNDIMGTDYTEGMNYLTLLDAARMKYNVFHIHIAQTKAGKIQETIDQWREYMGDNLIVVDNKEDVSNIIANIVSVGSDNMEKWDESQIIL
jgi:hypothetical protein